MGESSAPLRVGVLVVAYNAASTLEGVLDRLPASFRDRVDHILVGVDASGDDTYRTGLAYGVITYFVMNWVVVPLRFATPLPPKPLSIATQLFAHIVLVGIPIALVAARHLRPRA